MTYYPGPDNRVKDKVNVVLRLYNYATKNELKHVGGMDTSDLAAKKDFIASEAEVDILDINKLTNFQTSFNSLKIK